MHGASIGTAATCPEHGPPGNRAPGVRRSLYVPLTMTTLIGRVR